MSRNQLTARKSGEYVGEEVRDDDEKQEAGGGVDGGPGVELEVEDRVVELEGEERVDANRV